MRHRNLSHCQILMANRKERYEQDCSFLCFFHPISNCADRTRTRNLWSHWMLNQATVDRVKTLAEDGLSQRKIAKKVGIARESVRRILNGTRPNYAEKSSLEPVNVFSGVTGRCPGCGGFVHLPCLACKVRRKQSCNVQAKRQITTKCG